jgi:cell division protein FtsZ
MGIGISSGENRAAEAAKKAISSPLHETSIDGAKGVLMNITGGSNLSLFEVQEAADIVASASDEDVNMIFGSVINDNLKDEIIVTVIATGFSEDQNSTRVTRSGGFGAGRSQQAAPPQQQQQPLRETRESRREEAPSYQQEAPRREQQTSQHEDTLDIPTFLRNRQKRN